MAALFCAFFVGEFVENVVLDCGFGCEVFFYLVDGVLKVILGL